MKPSEALLEAKHLIEQCGWIQGEAGNKSIGFCMVGALANAVGRFAVGNKGQCELDEKTRDYVRRVTGATIIAVYNDAPVRTKDEVLAAFELAADLAKDEYQ